METMACIQQAIDFIEDNLYGTLKMDVVAAQAHMSPFYFQRVFSALCEVSPAEYIRNRRLSSAGIDVMAGDAKVIDIALKSGYETPESFTRAFTKFHGATPTAIRKRIAIPRQYARLTVSTRFERKMGMQTLQTRGYTVKENGPVYYTLDMDRTVTWFRDVLGWYGNIDARDEAGKGTYGCLTPIPAELVSMKISSFNGVHMYYGEPAERVVAFPLVEGIDQLVAFVRANGWPDVTDVQSEPWGGRVCTVKTIDGSLIRFFEV